MTMPQLNADQIKTTKASLKMLKGHLSGELGPKHDEIITLIISTRTHLLTSKDYTPRVIPLTHKLHKLGDQSVLMVTKDPVDLYRKTLTEKGCPTEEIFNDFISYGKVKSILRNLKKMVQLYKENDIVVADHRVHKRLPEVMGSQFYQKNRKVPLMIQVAKPDPFVELTKNHKGSSKLGRLKDERCDPKYVYKQLKAIVENTHIVPPANGTCVSIKVARSSWLIEEIIQNIEDVLEWLVTDKYKPVGGMVKGMKGIHSIHLKTGNSISLPVVNKEAVVEQDDEDNSDYDF